MDSKLDSNQTENTAMEIITNNQPRFILHARELSAKELAEFDYMDDEEKEFAQFFRYKGVVYDFGEFIVVGNNTMSGKLSQWHAYRSDSFFSGLVVKYTDDCESIIVGRYSNP